MQGQVTSSSSLNVRSGPGTDYQVITTVDNGMTLVITGEAEMGGMTWYQVEANGKTGFVRSDYVEAAPIPQGEPGQEEIGEEVGEPETGYQGFYEKPIFKKLVLIVAVILAVLTMLVLTLKGLRKDAVSDEDDGDDYGDEDLYEDGEAYADDAGDDVYEDGYAEDDGMYENEEAYEDGEYEDTENCRRPRGTGAWREGPGDDGTGNRAFGRIDYGAYCPDVPVFVWEKGLDLGSRMESLNEAVRWYEQQGAVTLRERGIRIVVE